MKDFIAFLKARPGYKNVLSSLGKAEKNDNSLFAAEIRRVAFALENLKKEAGERFALEYDFSSLANAREKSADLQRRIGRMNVRELSELVASPGERFELLEGILRKNPEFYRKDWQAYLDALQIESGFNEQDRARLAKHLENADWISNVENAKNAFRTATVSQDEIRTIIGLIATPEAKRALLRAIVPKISLSELLRMKIVGKTEAEAYVEDFVRTSWENRSSEVSASMMRDAEARAAETGSKDPKAERDRILKEIVSSLDPSAVFVRTGELSDEAVDVALKKSNVAAILEEKVSAGLEELKNVLDPAKSLETDRNGSSASSFAKKIAAEFSGNDDAKKNVAGIDLFLENARSGGGESVILE